MITNISAIPIVATQANLQESNSENNHQRNDQQQQSSYKKYSKESKYPSLALYVEANFNINLLIATNQAKAQINRGSLYFHIAKKLTIPINKSSIGLAL